MHESDRHTIAVPVEFIDAISHANSIESVLTAAARRLPGMIGADFSIVTFVEDDQQISQAFAESGVTALFGADTRIYPGTFGAQVLETGKPVVLDKTLISVPNHGLMPKMLEVGIEHVLIAPMRSGGSTVGTLTVANARDTTFTQDDIALAGALGKWIASHARLMLQARRTAQLAETDSLTGLANRARLRRVLNGPGQIYRPDSEGKIVGVMQIDLDDFKQVNDTLGHCSGDRLLAHCADAMLGTVGPKDLLARTGGDEFVVVTRTDPKGVHLERLAEKMIAAISVPLQLDDIEIRVGASIGTAIATEKDSSGDRLIGNADMALYEVKRLGRGGIHHFDERMRESNEQKMRLLSEISGALDRGEIVPFFQPQVSLTTGCFSGFEMLARWNHPDLGVLDPKDFLDLGDKAGLSIKIDDAIRHHGLSALSRLRAQGWDAPKMSFNASPHTLGRSNLIETLKTELNEVGLSPSDLVLEVREIDLRSLGKKRALHVIAHARESGFLVELDDFGNGIASMSTLAKAPVSALKIDGGLVAMLPEHRAHMIALNAIHLAHSLNARVVAEGVENAAQFSALRTMGCDFAQGFGISPPLPLPDLIDFMEGYGKAPVTLAKDTA